MSESLYDKYGGFASVSAIVGDFYERLLRSESLGKYFDSVDMTRLMDHQTKFLCMVLGGPDNYEGRTLVKAHTGLNITEEAFGEVAGHLKDSLSQAGVEGADIDTIIGVVASKSAEVIGL